MEPLAVSAVVSALNRVLGSVAEEAGKTAWAGLVTLVRSAFPARAAVREAVDALTPNGGTGTKPGTPAGTGAGEAAGSGGNARTTAGSAGTGSAAADQSAVIDLSAELVALARTDPAFEDALRAWLKRADPLAAGDRATRNVISGGAVVHGNVVQARDVGPISFGG